MSRFLRSNGLSILMFTLAAAFMLGLSITGARENAADQREHGQPADGYVAYVTSGEFGEAVFENWESEFLQMGCYVLFTIWLVQRGSSESKDPDARTRSTRTLVRTGTTRTPRDRCARGGCCCASTSTPSRPHS